MLKDRALVRQLELTPHDALKMLSETVETVSIPQHHMYPPGSKSKTRPQKGIEMNIQKPDLQEHRPEQRGV